MKKKILIKVGNLRESLDGTNDDAEVKVVPNGEELVIMAILESKNNLMLNTTIVEEYNKIIERIDEYLSSRSSP